MSLHALTTSNSAHALDHSFLTGALAKGALFEANQRPNDAIAIYQQILAKMPTVEEPINRIAQIFIRHKEYANAIKALQYQLSISQEKGKVLFTLGIVNELMDNQTAAFDYLKRSVQEDPRAVDPYFSLFTVAKVTHKVDQIKDFIKAQLEHQDHAGTKHYILGKLAEEEKALELAHTHFSEAEQTGLYERQLPYFYRDFAFLKHKLKDYPSAFNYHRKAQSLFGSKPEVKQVDTEKFKRFTQKSLQWFSSERVKDWQPLALENEKSPIFVVGFPRSGTTLIEQMLHAHPNLVVTDEAPVLKRSVTNLSKILNKKIEYPSGYKNLKTADIKKWREHYFKEIKAGLQEQEKSLRIVDKHPMSLRHLGTIKRFFPDAPIIVMLRDPRDVCLSNFFQTFRTNAFSAQCFDLESTFKLYANTMSLYLHFKQHLGLNILEIKYEDMCCDTENKMREVAAHIGEDFSDNMLNYYDDNFKRVVSTPSFEGVAKPIYHSAMQKWKNYETFVKPYQPIVARFIETFGYEL
ncbi:tetratricopeptide repeat-containing sulfotransferase family protein [Glaciecola sp. 1036]|uniref:tetratricopeptide repeat-containing sulfotransferase family protein n=1 Tax=Alteromonadaceae TaxID=72275 RepID=UPI003D088957